MKIKYLYRQPGFTLIELLVVVFIICLTSAVIVMRSGNLNNFREMRAFSELLKAQMRVAREQAIAQMGILGWQKKSDEYEFYQYNDDTPPAWVPLKDMDSFWTAYNIPPGMDLDVVTAEAKFKPGPQIIFYPSGEISAFTLTIRSQYTPRQLQLIGKPNGSIESQELS